MKREYVSNLPPDISPFIAEKFQGMLIDPESKLIFADDVQNINNHSRYGLGISYVSVREFMTYPRPNGTMRTTLQWELVNKMSELNSALANKISLTYAILDGDVSGIFVCSLFDKRHIVEDLHENRLPYAPEIERKLFIARKERVELEKGNCLCRFYRYKQHVGDILSSLFL